MLRRSQWGVAGESPKTPKQWKQVVKWTVMPFVSLCWTLPSLTTWWQTEFPRCFTCSVTHPGPDSFSWPCLNWIWSPHFTILGKSLMTNSKCRSAFQQTSPSLSSSPKLNVRCKSVAKVSPHPAAQQAGYNLVDVWSVAGGGCRLPCKCSTDWEGAERFSVVQPHE